MIVFVFDYRGTLTTLSNPVQYIQNLRTKHPDSKVFLHTGSEPGLLDIEHPGLREVLDGIWMKPTFLLDALKPFQFDQVVVVDDDPDIRKATTRVLRSLAGRADVLDETALQRLVA